MNYIKENPADYHLKFSLVLIILSLGLLLSSIMPAQVNYNQRDDKYRLLGLKRAKELFETSRKEYDRAKELFSKKYISEAEYEKARAVYSDAEVNYQQSLLAVLFENQFITVERAIKYQAKDGQKHVRLRIANMSRGGEEFQKLINIDDKLFNSLQPDIINNVYISLSNEQGSIVSQPYEEKINQLKFGKPIDLDFMLLQDLDAVMVNMIYGNGTTRGMKIFLQKDASKNTVVVQSQQFSQEVELGKSAVFDLTLELYSGTKSTYSLDVVNLPKQVNRFFKDPDSKARLSQFKFTESVNTRKAALEISLPDRPTSEIAMDKPIPFYVLVIPNEMAGKIEGLGSKIWKQEDIEKLNVGFVKLELVPRGNGRLLIRAQQLFYSSTAGSKVNASIELVNEGSRRLDNTQVKLDLPLNWTGKVIPDVVSSLSISEEKRINIEVTPPDDVAAGRYEIRLRTSALSDNQPVTAEDKTITVEIRAETNVFAVVAIVVLILGLIGGIVAFGIKLSRK